VLRGGQDDDVMYGGAGDDWLSGDRGGDSIWGGAGADSFHTWSAADLDRVMDFNRAEGDRVLVSEGAAYSFAQVGADVVISVGGSAQMVLAGVDATALTDGWIVSI
jgi:serralysin